jgi:hypothetical protein
MLAARGLVIAMPLLVGATPAFIVGVGASVAIGLVLEAGFNYGAKLLVNASKESETQAPIP